MGCFFVWLFFGGFCVFFCGGFLCCLWLFGFFVDFFLFYFFVVVVLLLFMGGRFSGGVLFSVGFLGCGGVVYFCLCVDG